MNPVFLCCALAEPGNDKEHSAESKTIDFIFHQFLFSVFAAPRYLLFAPCSFYLMTLSASASTLGVNVRPMCLAAIKLMMNSNFVGCSTIDLQISFMVPGLKTFDCAA